MQLSILSVLVTFFALSFAFSENHIVEIVARQGDTGSGGESTSDANTISVSQDASQASASSAAAQSTANSLASEVGSSSAAAISSSFNAAASSTGGAAVPLATGQQWAYAGIAALAGALAL